MKEKNSGPFKHSGHSREQNPKPHQRHDSMRTEQRPAHKNQRNASNFEGGFRGPYKSNDKTHDRRNDKPNERSPNKLNAKASDHGTERSAEKPKQGNHNTTRPKWLLKPPDEIDCVFFDLETTGGNPTNSMIIEIAAIKYSRGIEVARFDTLVNPKRKIPRIVQEITGVNQEMVKAAPTIEEVIEEFILFVGDSVLVAHGVISDYSFIRHACRECMNRPFSNYYLCTHLLVTNLMPELPSKTLSGVANTFGVKVENAHRAMVDAELTRDVFLGLVGYGKLHGIHTTEDFLKIQGDNETLKRLGPGLSTQEIDAVPTGPGVFYLFNSQSEISYLSSSPNLRRSISTITELSEEREFNRLIVDISDYKFERTNHYLGALLSEEKELSKFHLALDPRKLENRSRGLVQILLPQDLLTFINENPGPAGLEIFGDRGRVNETVREFESLYSERLALAEPGRESAPKSGYDNSDLEDFLDDGTETIAVNVPVRKTRIAYPSMAKGKYSLVRLKGNETPLQFNQLTHGVGWVFGPYEQPKVIQKEFEKLVAIFPFHDARLGFNRRVLYLRLLVGHLYDRLDEEIAALSQQKRTARYIFSGSFRRTLNDTLERLEKLGELNIPRGRDFLPQSGLAIVSNTDAKELDVAVVVRNRVREVVRLPIEESDKLQSKRYFTRLFCKYNDELLHDSFPILFTDDVCSQSELFHNWKKFRNLEGDFVYFEDLSSLYDLALL